MTDDIKQLNEAYDSISQNLNQQGLYQQGEFCIVDSEENEVYSKGTLAQLKDWWWKQLTDNGEIGGYQLMSREDYEKIEYI